MNRPKYFRTVRFTAPLTFGIATVILLVCSPCSGAMASHVTVPQRSHVHDSLAVDSAPKDGSALERFQVFVPENFSQELALPNFPPLKIKGLPVSDLTEFEITDGNQQNLFTINTQTGQIKINGNDRLDFETCHSFRIKISMQRSDKAPSDLSLEEQFLDTLQDSGIAKADIAPQLRHHATIELDVFITDVNEPPQCHDQILKVAENSFRDSVVGNVVASDPDQNDSLSFALLNTSAPFGIDPQTGVVTVTAPSELDFERSNSFDCHVRVTDSHRVHRDIKLRIVLQDVNEAPILKISPLNSSFDLGDSWKLRLAAVDPDCSDHVTYTLIDDPTNGGFSLDPESGDLRVNQAEQLRQFGHQSCEIVIQACDAGGCTSESSVQIMWTDTAALLAASSQQPPAQPSAWQNLLSLQNWSLSERLMGMVIASLLALTILCLTLLLRKSKVTSTVGLTQNQTATPAAEANSIALSSNPLTAAAVDLAQDSKASDCRESDQEIEIQSLRAELQRQRTDANRQRERQETETAALQSEISALKQALGKTTEELRLATLNLENTGSECQAIEELKLQVRQRNQLIIELRTRLHDVTNPPSKSDTESLPFHASCELAESWEFETEPIAVSADTTLSTHGHSNRDPEFGDLIAEHEHEQSSEPESEDQALMNIREQLAGLFSLTAEANNTKQQSETKPTESVEESHEESHEESINTYMARLLNKKPDDANYVDSVLSRYSPVEPAPVVNTPSSTERRGVDRRVNNDPSLVPAVDRRKGSRRAVDVAAIRNDMNSFREVSRNSVEKALATHTLRKAQAGLLIRKLLLLSLLLGLVFATFANLAHLIQTELLMWVLGAMIVVSATELGVRITRLRLRVDHSRQTISKPQKDETLKSSAPHRGNSVAEDPKLSATVTTSL